MIHVYSGGVGTSLEGKYPRNKKKFKCEREDKKINVSTKEYIVIEGE